MSTSATGKGGTRARASAAGSGASPELRQKRKHCPTPEDEPLGKRRTMSDEGQKQIMAAIQDLNKRFDDVPSRRDINQLEVNIRSRIQENSKEISKVREVQNEDRANLPKVVRKLLSEELTKTKTARTGQQSMTPDEIEKENNALGIKCVYFLFFYACICVC